MINLISFCCIFFISFISFFNLLCVFFSLSVKVCPPSSSFLYVRLYSCAGPGRYIYIYISYIEWPIPGQTLPFEFRFGCLLGSLSAYPTNTTNTIILKTNSDLFNFLLESPCPNFPTQKCWSHIRFLLFSDSLYAIVHQIPTNSRFCFASVLLILS